MRPLISYIIPAYNLPQELLRQCIESVLRLSEGVAREVLVVDDGSTPPVCAEHLPAPSDTASLTLLREDNQGAAAARNAALDLAQGEYIQFVDGDDLLLEGYRQCLTILQHEQPDILTFNYQTRLPKATTHTATTHTASRPHPSTTTGTAYMQHRNLPCLLWRYIFRRSLIATDRFVPGLAHEDERFIPPLFLRAQSVAESGITAYYYRQREGSLQHTFANGRLQKRLTDHLDTIVCFRRMLPTLSLPQRAALSRRIHQLTMDHIYNTIAFTRSPQALEQAISHLQRENLFPLPYRSYTLKYLLFALLANHALTRRLLLQLP